MQHSVNFLGHVVSEKGISCDPKKIEYVQNIETPATRTEVRSILGLGNYYRKFIKDYALITYPMQQLTHLDVGFQWGLDEQMSLDRLKNALSSAPVLAYPSPSEDCPIIVDTDASDYQIGGVLSQIQDGEERVIAYSSKGFVGSQKRWCTTRRELWAMIYMVTHAFRHYLLGREFTLRTDHSSLIWVESFVAKASEALCRWLFYLEPFRPYMKIIHRPGPKHGNADAMSRVETRKCPREDCPDPGHKVARKKVKKIQNVFYTNINKPPPPHKLNPVTDANIDGDAMLVPSLTLVEMECQQHRDPDINKFKQLLKKHEHKPGSKELSGESHEVRTYCAMWSEFLLYDDILYRRKKESKMSCDRLVLPKSCRKDIMTTMHE